ncbi:MAG TPA: purine-nucleoside phosphorylase [Acidimicrobiales bacterium]|nr:purine-nucleoside phosphorylase [Acidimicrobiales bacterium]
MPTTSPGAPGANPFEQARIAARELGRMTRADRHDVLVVLGTGLFGAAERLGAEGAPVDLTSLPWFARLTGPDHRPEAWSVNLESKRTLVVAGRLHLYEGRSPAEVVHLVRTAVAAGVGTIVLTCSAGALNPSLAVGDVVAVRDHLNMTGVSPLVGVTAHGATGSRHVDMTDAWSPRLRALARAVGPIAEGVYAQMPGPQLETPAEIRMLATLGADLVGMSMVPEAIAARHLGAEVLGLSVVTNTAAGAMTARTGVDDVVEVAAGAVPTLAQVITGVVRALGDEAQTPPDEAGPQEVPGGDEPGRSP